MLSDGALRDRMADAANGHGRPHAAADIARDLLELAGVSPRAARNGARSNGSGPRLPSLEVS